MTFRVRKMTSSLARIVAIFGLLLGVGSHVDTYADTGNLVINATVLSKSNCKFDIPGTATISFPAIDPSGAAAQVLSGALSFTCRGSAPTATYSIVQDGGLYNSAGNRMRHSTNFAEFLPYSLALSPSSGSAPKNVSQPLTATITIPIASFQQAIVGTFADTVVITVSP